MEMILSELEKFYIEQNFEKDNFNLFDEIDSILSEFIDGNSRCYNYFKVGIMLLFDRKWRASSRSELFSEIARINELSRGDTVNRSMGNYILKLFGNELKPLKFNIERYTFKFNKKPTVYTFMYQIYREIITKNYKYFES